MEKTTLLVVKRLLESDDHQMIQLGSEIFLGNQPTDDDIDNLNTLRGLPGIMATHRRKQIEDFVKECSGRTVNIL